MLYSHGMLIFRLFILLFPLVLSFYWVLFWQQTGLMEIRYANDTFCYTEGYFTSELPGRKLLSTFWQEFKSFGDKICSYSEIVNDYWIVYIRLFHVNFVFDVLFKSLKVFSTKSIALSCGWSKT